MYLDAGEVSKAAKRLSKLADVIIDRAETSSQNLCSAEQCARQIKHALTPLFSSEAAALEQAAARLKLLNQISSDMDSDLAAWHRTHSLIKILDDLSLSIDLPIELRQAIAQSAMFDARRIVAELSKIATSRVLDTIGIDIKELTSQLLSSFQQ